MGHMEQERNIKKRHDTYLYIFGRPPRTKLLGGVVEEHSLSNRYTTMVINKKR